MIRNPITLPAILFLCLGALLFVAACGDDDSPVCPEFEVGVLEGYVTSAGEGVAAMIEARFLDRESPLDGWAETESDSTGYYRMELPHGLYRLEVEDLAYSSYSSSSEDTIRIGSGNHRFDFPMGRLVVHLTLPGNYEDESFRLICQNLTGPNASRSERVADGQLAFDLGLLHTGTYRLELDPPRADNLHLPGTYDRNQATQYLVGPGEVVHVEQDLALLGATISGQVQGSWLQAGEGSFQIDVYTLEHDRMGYTSCDDDGSFFLPVVLGQDFRMTTRNGGIMQWLGGDDFETATVFPLQPGGSVSDLVHVESGLKVRLEGPGATLEHSGDIRVRDEEGTLYNTNFSRDSVVFLSNLRPGRYYLFVDGICHDQVWAPRWFGGDASFASAAPIDLVPGGMLTVTLDLEEGGRLDGGILAPPGLDDVVQGYQLYDSAGEQICYTRSWPGGGMHYSGLPDGTYLMAAVIGYSGPWYYPGTWDEDLARSVVILDNSQATIEWNLPGIIPEAVR